jgi:hypothetical protein
VLAAAAISATGTEAFLGDGGVTATGAIEAQASETLLGSGDVTAPPGALAGSDLQAITGSLDISSEAGWIEGVGASVVVVENGPHRSASRAWLILEPKVPPPVAAPLAVTGGGHTTAPVGHMAGAGTVIDPRNEEALAVLGLIDMEIAA